MVEIKPSTPRTDQTNQIDEIDHDLDHLRSSPAVVSGCAGSACGSSTAVSYTHLTLPTIYSV